MSRRTSFLFSLSGSSLIELQQRSTETHRLNFGKTGREVHALYCDIFFGVLVDYTD